MLFSLTAVGGPRRWGVGDPHNTIRREAGSTRPKKRVQMPTFICHFSCFSDSYAQRGGGVPVTALLSACTGWLRKANKRLSDTSCCCRALTRSVCAPASRFRHASAVQIKLSAPIRGLASKCNAHTKKTVGVAVNSHRLIGGYEGLSAGPVESHNATHLKQKQVSFPPKGRPAG